MDVKISELEKPDKGWVYHSGGALFMERFIDGRLMSASFRCSGIALEENAYVGLEENTYTAFNFQLDGESMSFGWELENAATEDNKRGIPESHIFLKHTMKPVKLEIVTQCCGNGFFRRRINITNTSKAQSTGLSSAEPMRGAIWKMTENLASNLSESGQTAYSVGRMRDTTWCSEGNFQWDGIPLNTELAFGSDKGRSGFSTPFAVVRNNVYGGYFILGLAWSANWEMRFMSESVLAMGDGVKSNLRFTVAPVAPAPMRIIAPGETVSLPETHFGMNSESFDSAIQNWHRHLRENVLATVGDGNQPVIYNTWAYVYQDLSESSLMCMIDEAAEVGVELFVVDAGWYADKGSAWGTTTGDWNCGNRLPNDLFPVFDYARSKGMLVGLWVDVESAGKDSNLAKEHPDWFITRYGKPVERILDLTSPVVAAYVESSVFRLIDRYKLDMFRLDSNNNPVEGGFKLRDGKMENTLWRHVEVVHEIFDKVRKQYPGIQLQNCSGGGGRSDLGMLERFTTTQASDWMKMPRAVRILNGMSMALPPEYVDRYFGAGQSAAQWGNAETLMQMVIMGHPVMSGLGINGLSGANPNLLGMVKKYIGIYKDFIRPFHRMAKVYHHTPVIKGFDSSGYCALEYVSEDRSKAVACIFRLANAPNDAFAFRFRGLDSAGKYKITFEPSGTTALIDGFSLIHQGLPVFLDTALTSSMMLCEVVS